MDLYSILNPSSNLGNTSYHLIQLSNELLDDLNKERTEESQPVTTMSDNEKLLIKYDLKESHQFKSTDHLSTPYLTTMNSTFKLRQQNHSNCVMLLDQANSFLNFDSYLIIERQNMAQLSQIKFNFKDITVIELKSFTDIPDVLNDSTCMTINAVNNIFKSCRKLFENTPISIVEFDALLNQNGLIPNFDTLVKINSTLEMAILNLILSYTDSEVPTLTNAQLTEIIKQASAKIHHKFKFENTQHLIIRMILNVLQRYIIKEKLEVPENLEEIDQFIYYSLSNTHNSKLNHNKIIKFLTMTILGKERKILLDDLLIQIRLNLPSNYLPNFEINEILNGFSYTKKLDNNMVEINYLTPDELSVFKNPKERFEKLFNYKSQWVLEEIQPFITPLNTKGIKIDKFCLKYCRVKKVKNQTVLLRR